MKKSQQDIVQSVADATGIPWQPSDAFLLAHLKDVHAGSLDEQQLRLIEPFRRAGGYRFCLTPYFVDRDRNHGLLW
jgi:hypothetical protein